MKFLLIKMGVWGGGGGGGGGGWGWGVWGGLGVWGGNGNFSEISRKEYSRGGHGTKKSHIQVEPVSDAHTEKKKCCDLRTTYLLSSKSGKKPHHCGEVWGRGKKKLWD